jgi:5-methylcytosine-specific restriction enzyme subunit McrC
MMRRSVREWSRLEHGSGPDQLSESQVSRLAKVASESTFAGQNGEGVLDHRRTHLRAKGVVGVVTSSDCQLEILPKIDCPGERGAPTDDLLRHRLVSMLAISKNIKIDTQGTADLGWQRDNLLEILIRIFCQKMMEAVRQGMPRRYLSHQDDLPSLRGRLNVTRQFSTLVAEPQRLACDYDDLTADIPLNQAMKAAVHQLSRLALASDNRRVLRELSFAYADVALISPGALRWDRITIDRTTTRWQELLSLAKLLLGEQFQTTNSGSSRGTSLLFEMNVLFEEYCANLLRSALSGSGLTVRTQGGHQYCLFDEAKGRFQTKPDIIVKQGTKVRAILDTKWKRLASSLDDAKQGVSQSDVYQLMAYSQLYRCDDVILLYPYHSDLGVGHCEDKQYRICEQNGDKYLRVHTIDVSASHNSVQQRLRQIMDSSFTI